MVNNCTQIKMKTLKKILMIALEILCIIVGGVGSGVMIYGGYIVLKYAYGEREYLFAIIPFFWIVAWGTFMVRIVGDSIRSIRKTLKT